MGRVWFDETLFRLSARWRAGRDLIDLSLVSGGTEFDMLPKVCGLGCSLVFPESFSIFELHREMTPCVAAGRDICLRKNAL